MIYTNKHQKFELYCVNVDAFFALRSPLMTSAKQNNSQEVVNFLQKEFPFRAHPITCFAWDHRFQALAISTIVLGTLFQQYKQVSYSITSKRYGFFYLLNNNVKNR